MPDFDLTYRSEGQNRRINPTNENLALDSDMAMESILENIHNTPIGQVLKRIATLPEIRKNKVLKLRFLFILGCAEIAIGVFSRGMDLPFWFIHVFWGIFMLGFWTIIMIVNPELKDYGEERNE